MKYITASGLNEYRKNNKSSSCDILSITNYKAVVDHDHTTGKIRGVISSEGNVLLGKIENCFKSRCSKCIVPLPEVLRCIADYLEKPQGPYHPLGVRQLRKRFVRMNKKDQIKILLEEYDKKTIDMCKYSVERSKLYREKLTER